MPNKEHNLDKITSLVGRRLTDYCMKVNVSEPVVAITILRSKLSTMPVLNSLEDYLKGNGSQWEKVKITYKDVPDRVECNTCGTRFNAHTDWTPCPDCGDPGTSFAVSPYQLKLKEIQLESGAMLKAKRNTILLL